MTGGSAVLGAVDGGATEAVNASFGCCALPATGTCLAVVVGAGDGQAVPLFSRAMAAICEAGTASALGTDGGVSAVGGTVIGIDDPFAIDCEGVCGEG